MANSTSHAALPYPIKNARFSLEQAFVTSAGVLTDPTTPDTEISTDGGATFADTTEEITTGGSNGVGYLTLTGAEMNNDVIALAFKSANCVTRAKTLVPRNLATVGSGTLSAGSAGGGTLGTLLAYDVTGCFIRTTGGTGGGGTGGANNQARKIVTYNTSTGAFTVTPNWATTPDNTTTYDVLLPEGVTLGMLKALNSTSPIQTAGDIYAYLTTNVGALGANLSAIPKTGFKLASDGLSAISAWTVNITGTLSGSVGSISGITFPSNFSALVISGTGYVNAYLTGIISTALSEGATGRIAAAWQAAWNVASSVWTSASVNQTGDSYSRIGATGSGLTSLAPASTALSTAQWTNARAAYLDNLNVGGVVASHADILAINQSASKHILIQTVGQYERPESGSTVYTVEIRTFAADTGNAVNADSTPTLTATGQTTGSLSGNLGALSNPATGVYRAAYTVTNTDTAEPIRFDVSAAISSSTYTLSCYTQVIDEVSQTWTSTDRSMLTGVYNKLPTNNIADETLVLAAVASVQADTDDIQSKVASVQADTDDIQSKLGAPSNLGSGATIAANLVDIESQTDDIGIAGAGLTNIGDTRLAYLDAAISSRLASAGYTAPPSAASIASAVRTELGTELARIDAAISSRMATFSYTTPPTVAAITTAIMTDLMSGSNYNTTGSFGKLIKDYVDASVSSRMATFTYTTPPTANENADAFLDRTDGVETGVTPRKWLRRAAAALFGKSSGGGTATERYRNQADDRNRITATVNPTTGDRSAITFDDN